MKLKDFRQRCKSQFRTTLIDYLNNNYIFFEKHIENTEELKTYVDNNFRKLTGKIYSTQENQKKLIYASTSNDSLLGIRDFKLD
jgi:hypothetical protein